MSARFWLAALVPCLGGLAGCGAPSELTSKDDSATVSQAAGGTTAEVQTEDAVHEEDALFEDVSAATGLDFVHFNGMAGRFYYSEMMGSGGALFDADGDGDLDLFLVQGAELGGVAAADTLRPPGPSMLPLRDRLYLHEGLGESGTPKFRDATDACGLDSRGYGMGAVAADFDGDGNEDLYVTNAGPNELWLGRGDGTFEGSADEASRIAEWSVAAVPLDADGDGDLDLFVANYVNYQTSVDKNCTDTLGQRNYCGPLAYPPVRDVLLRNRGDGTFDDVSLSAGLSAAYGRALGATAADLDAVGADRDGDLEIFVANDGDENQLWHLRSDSEDLAYQDEALLWGVAVNATGHAEASMGVALGDADSDGLADLFVSHLNRETNTLYLARRPASNDGHGGFDDRSTESGLGAPSFNRTGFGTVFVDWDLDGDLDLPVANGAVKVIAEQSLVGDDYPLHQPNQLFRNVSQKNAVDTETAVRFEEVAGDPWSQASEVSRAVLAGDLDDDGDADLVLTNNAGPARVFRNLAGDGRAWIGAVLRTARGGIAHHAVAELTRPDGRRLVRQVAVATGYASSQDPRLRFGLGASAGEDTTVDITVRWLDGGIEHFPGLEPGRYHELRPGEGRGDTDR